MIPSLFSVVLLPIVTRPHAAVLPPHWMKLLAESRASLEALLGRIADMFQDSGIIRSTMRPALQAGFKLMVSVLNFPCYLTFELTIRRTGAYWWKFIVLSFLWVLTH